MVRTTSNFSHGSTTIRNIISSWIIYLLSIMASHFCKSMSKEKAACTKIELTALCYHVIYLSGVDNLLRIVGQEVKEGLGIEGANWTNLFQSTLWALGVMDSNAFRAPPKKNRTSERPCILSLLPWSVYSSSNSPLVLSFCIVSTWYQYINSSTT